MRVYLVSFNTNKIMPYTKLLMLRVIKPIFNIIN